MVKSTFMDSTGLGYSNALVNHLLSDWYKLSNKNKAFKAAFEQWKNTFSPIYGQNRIDSLDAHAFTLPWIQTAYTGKSILFIIQTYFVMILKGILSLYLLNILDHKSFLSGYFFKDNLAFIKHLQGIECGSLPADFGMEGLWQRDCFSWYLEVQDDTILNTLLKLHHHLFNHLCDLTSDANTFRSLYMDLIPKSVRKHLGEYYTPLWLAQLLLDRVGFKGDSSLKILDPSSGSGIFIYEILKRILNNPEQKQSPQSLLSLVLKNVHAWDINPIAILNTKAAYIFALSHRIAILKSLDLPVYQRDAILTRLAHDKIATQDQFDWIIGNPPWIRLRYLDLDYFQQTIPLWKQYGLFSLDAKAGRLGGGEKDLSMLFLYACADGYLRTHGKLGFLITSEAFKSKGAGEGFRRFQLGNASSLQVLEALDFTDINPFEGAANKTAAIILKKGAKTSYPVPYLKFSYQKSRSKISNHPNLTWQQSKSFLQWDTLLAHPIGNQVSSWQTFSAKDKQIIDQIRGTNPYASYSGTITEPYGVYWIQVKEWLEDGLALIENLPEKGKRDIPKTQSVIERDLIFPGVCGRNIQPFAYHREFYLLIPQNPAERKPYSEAYLKQYLPFTYEYLLQFKDILLTRGSKAIVEFAKKTAFYAMLGIGPYSMAPFKIIWRRMASDLIAAVFTKSKGSAGIKPFISTDTTAYIPVYHKQEAHYICAVLNAPIIRRFIKSYSSTGRGFGAASVLQYVGIPLFDASNPLHRELADFSVKMHYQSQPQADFHNSFSEVQLNNLVMRLFS